MIAVRQQLLDSFRRLAGEQGDTPAEDGDSPLQDSIAASPLQFASSQKLDPVEVLRSVAQALAIPFLESLGSSAPSADFVNRIPISFARHHSILGLAASDSPMPVAVGNLQTLRELDVLTRYLGKPVEPRLAAPEQIAAAINLAYQARTGQAQGFIEQLDKQDVLRELDQLGSRDDLLDNATRAPVVKLVNLLLFEAVQQQASDVHVQPGEQTLTARLRIDGVLFNAFSLPKALQEEIISRIKILGRMNIAEKRLAQDGRATVQVGDRIIDLRISTLPTSFGERAVIRLLDKSARLYSLTELGMSSGTLDLFRELIGVEHGLLLVTGPTGSGKTTTLYAALSEIDREQHNILTLEDPIEYQLPDISQTQVSDKKGMTFASGLRSVLRQDPDIIMVGEIRDHDTAAMAIQSALTGHLVFSTLHTNDSASAVTRLMDLGIESYLVASSVVGVMAQRLVRRICPECSAPTEASVQELARLEIDPARLAGANLRRGAGCRACRQTGYSGRRGIFELMVVTNTIRDRIGATAGASAIKAAAIEQGMKTLREDGVQKVIAGITTLEEVARVTMRATI